MAVVTQTIQDQVAELYIGFFGRAADAAGFGYWANELATGKVTPQKIADDFSKSPEFVSMYDGLTPTQQVTRAYQNVLDRAPDTAGLAYWVAELNAGTSIGTVVWQIVNAAFVQQGTADGLLVQNKVKVSEYFAINLASNDTEVAKTAFDGVTSDPATVIAKEAELDAAVNAGATYTLTTSIETINGTPLNDTFNGLISSAAGATTFQTGDILDGKGGANNVLNITVAGAGGVATADTLVQTSNIQDVDLRSVATAAQTIDAALWSGVTNICTQESFAAGDVTVSNVANQVSANSIRSAGDLTVNYAAGALGSTSVNQHFTLVDSNKSSIAVVAAGSDRFTAATIDAKGTASSASIEIQQQGGAAYVETLTITGTGSLDLTYKGRGESVLQNTASLKTIDATGNTGGVTYATQIAAQNTLKVLKGGSGDDSFIINSLTSKATVDLGAGNDFIAAVKNTGTVGTPVWVGDLIGSTNVVDGGIGTDTITATSLSAANAANIKNFEVLNLDGAKAVYDASLFTNSTFNALEITDDMAGATTVTNLAGSVIDLTVDVTNGLVNQNLTATLASSAGATDVAAINFVSAVNASLVSFTSTGIETVLIASGGDTGVANDITSVNVTNNTLTTVSMTGANALTLGGVHTNTTLAAGNATVASSLTLIDGSAVTAGQAITAGANDTVNGNTITYTGLTIKGGSGNDAITIGAKNGVVQSGGGNDTITTQNFGITVTDAVGTDKLVVGAGSTWDFVTVAPHTNYSSSKLGSTVTGFTAGDQIDLNSVIGATGPTITNYTTTALTFGSLTDAINAYIAGGATEVGFINWTDGNTYIVADHVNGAVDTAAVVELVGTYTSMTAAAGVITLA